MKSVRAVLSLLTLLCLAAPSPAADLAKIDRTIKKEPAYQGKPLYCLLVFGEEARVRAWLVVDGDVLYVDRHGDGDLTHPDDRLPAHRARKEPLSPTVRETRTFLDGGPTLTGTDRYAGLWMNQVIPRDGARPGDPGQAEYLGLLRRHYTALLLRVGGKHRLAWACFSERPQTAPVLHFDGPLTLGLGQNFGPLRRRFVRGPAPVDFAVNVLTPGLGEGALVTMDNRCAPADADPVAEIAFPSRHAGGKPIRVKAVLKERC